MPVSTRTGSLPCSTNALMASEPRAGMSAVVVITSTPGVAVKQVVMIGLFVGFGGSSWARVLGFGRRLEALEGGAHALEQVLVAVGGHVEDAGPRRDPPHLVALGHPGAAVAQGLEPVAPHGGLAAALVGDEGELAARIGDQHPAVARVADAPPGPDRVVSDEGGALRGDGDVAFPARRSRTPGSTPRCGAGRRPSCRARRRRLRCRARRGRRSTTNAGSSVPCVRPSLRS